MSALAERLGEIEQYSEVTLTLADGTTVEGQVYPITYDPGGRFRMELRPFDEETSQRFEVYAAYDEGEWTSPTVRKIEPATEDDWTELADVEDFSVR